MSTTRTTKFIQATPQTLYRAFTSSEALETWLAPGTMVGKIHRFDLQEGGGYEMSLFYPESEQDVRGKTTGKEDRYSAQFDLLEPDKKIVERIRFDSTDVRFQGEMIMEVYFEPADKEGTQITMIFRNIPPGIRPEDNEKGTELSLHKLEQYVAANPGK